MTFVIVVLVYCRIIWITQRGANLTIPSTLADSGAKFRLGNFLTIYIAVSESVMQHRFGAKNWKPVLKSTNASVEAGQRM